MDTTPGGANANSYVTIEESNEYFNTKYRSNWDIDDDIK
jgi:hypothetical protein